MLFSLVVLVFALAAQGAQIQLDLSSGFNTDNIVGPKEYQAVRQNTANGGPAYDLLDFQGSWSTGDGIQAYYALQQSYLLVAKSSTEQYAIFGVYPYNTQLAWVGQNPIGTPANEGIDEYGIYTGIGSREYHIASFGGNATYSGDWTETTPVTYTTNKFSMSAKANAMSIMCNNALTYKIMNAVATLPAGQQGTYSDINFVLGGWQQTKLALNARIMAVYADGEETLYTFNTNSAVAEAQAILADAKGNTDSDFTALGSMTQAYNVTAGVTGDIRAYASTLYEFSVPLKLDGARTLIGIKLVDVDQALTNNTRGLSIFGATATEATAGAPVADFSANPLTGKWPLEVTFADSSAGTVTNRFWDFGDGSSNSTASGIASHTYATAGVYSVTLTVSGAVGSDTLVKTDLITVTNPPVPVASFSASSVSGDQPLTVDFTDTSTGTITSRVWDFGDGSTTNIVATTIRHIYANAGTFTVSLITTGPTGVDTNTQVGLISIVAVVGTQVYADTDDQGWTITGIPTHVGQSTARIGTQTGQSLLGFVIPFYIPDLQGQVITGATLKITHVSETAAWIPSVTEVDVYGVRSDVSNSTTQASDMTTSTATLVIDNFFAVKAGENGTVATNSTDLAIWIDGEVGTTGQKYLFLRLIPEALAGDNVYSTMATADNTSFPGPKLVLTLGGGGPVDLPTAPTVILVLGGGDPNVIDWTTESGHTYDVFYSTNLVSGFLPLASNLADTVNSYEHFIDAPAVFYQIKAK